MRAVRKGATRIAGPVFAWAPFRVMTYAPSRANAVAGSSSMPFYVYGKNALTGEVAKRLYCAAATREEARQEAQDHGLEVTEIIACNLAPAGAGGGPIAPSAGSARSSTPALGAISQFRKELDYATPNTYATFALIALNALVFGMMCLSGVSAKDPTIDGLMRWGADFGPSTLGGQWWRMFTSLFVHIGFLHLLYNMLALVPAGRSLERLVGSRNFLLIYLVAGLGGSLWALYWSPLILSAGASGAVFGIYGALGGLVLMRGQAMAPELSAALKKSVIAFVAYNAMYSLQPGVSLAAHVGGLVVGFVGGLVVASAEPAEETELIPDRARPMLALGLVLALAGFFCLHMRYPNLPGLQDAFAHFDALDQKDSQIVIEAARKFDRKDISGAEFVELMNKDVLPDWDAMRATLTGYRPVPAGMQGEVDAVASYMQLRAEAWKMFAEALRDGGKEKFDTASQKMREGNAADRALFRSARTRIFPARKQT
jgi:rhomboid protease GluP